MAFCTICGAQLEPGAKFCVVCGAVVSQQAAPDPTPAQPAEPVQPAPPVTGVYNAQPPVSGSFDAQPSQQQIPPRPAPSYQPVPQQPSFNEQQSFNGQQPFNEQQPFTPLTDNGSGFDPQDVQENKVMAVLAYSSRLIRIPLFARRNSPFVRFHCNQGLILVIAGVAITIVRSIVVNAIGVNIGFVFSLLSLAVFVFSIIGIVNAAQGQAKELPLIGSLRILK